MSELQAELQEVRLSRARLAQAALEERRRIERDLHDGIQQHLLAINLRLGGVAMRSPDGIREELEILGKDLQSALIDFRNQIADIHPSELRQSGVTVAVTSVARKFDFPISVYGTRDRFPPAIEATAYFVLCEAITNAAKHSGCTQMFVITNNNDGMLEFTVGDNGKGGVNANGHGVLGMSDRIRSLGGTFEITSDDEYATVIKGCLPPLQ